MRANEYGPRPVTGPTIAASASLADACLRVSRAVDGRLFACARETGHPAPCYGRDRRGMVRLG